MPGAHLSPTHRLGYFMAQETLLQPTLPRAELLYPVYAAVNAAGSSLPMK